MIVPASRFEQVAAAIAASAPPPPAAVNVLNALHLHEPEILEFRGLRWKVEPISAPEGLRLMELSGAVHAAQAAGDLAGLRAAHAAAVTFMWRLVKRPRWWRLGWSRNPLRRANMMEVGHLLHFFAQLQTTSGVRFRFMKVDASPTSTIRN